MGSDLDKNTSTMPYRISYSSLYIMTRKPIGNCPAARLYPLAIIRPTAVVEITLSGCEKHKILSTQVQESYDFLAPLARHMTAVRNG